MKRKYTVLLFDADGTLFDYEAAERNALMKSFRHFAVSRNENDIVTGYRLINHDLWKKFESGIISLPALRTERFVLLFDSLDLHLDPHEFGKFYINYLGEGDILLPDTLELLEILYGKYRMALITNGIAEVQYRRLESSGLDRFFPVIVISEEIGYPKPDPQFFESTLQRLDNPLKEEILIIGDSLTSDIAGGNLSGIDTCWFNPEDKLNDSEYLPTHEIRKLPELLKIINNGEKMQS